MFDLLLTLGLVYLGYRGYRWYSGVREQVQGGMRAPFEVGPEEKQSGKEDEYIDYEEIE